MTIILSNLSRLIWLLTTPQHLKYVATLPCNLSLMACFGDTNVSQGSVATYARCGGIFNIHLTANLLRNLPARTFFNRSTFYRIMVTAPLLWPTLYVRLGQQTEQLRAAAMHIRFINAESVYTRRSHRHVYTIIIRTLLPALPSVRSPVAKQTSFCQPGYTFCCRFLFFDDSRRTSYLNIYRTDLRQIFRVEGRTNAVDGLSELSFSIPRGTSPWSPVFVGFIRFIRFIYLIVNDGQTRRFDSLPTDAVGPK